MKNVPIIVSFNKKYLIPALITILSVIRSSPSSKKMEFFVMHNGLDRYIIRLCEGVIISWGHVVNFINVEGNIKEFHNPSSSIYSGETFNTLLIPSLFSKYEKVVYLDVDLLVRDDIFKLLHELPETKKIGAVRCFLRNYTRYGDDFHALRGYARDVLKVKRPYDYFNSGVLVFNNKNISPQDAEGCINLLNKNWEHHDEGILNHVFQDDVYLFSSRWNMYASYVGENVEHFSPAVCNDLLEAGGDYSIVHFMAERKPWLDSGLDMENIYMREYGKLWEEVKQCIEKLAPSILCGSMWKIMNRVGWRQ